MPIAHYLLPDLINVPGGDFAMGSDSHGRNEAPVHRVWIDPFALAKYPVTRKEYALFVAATGHSPPTFWHELPFQHPEQPVAGPSWNDAVAYCTWLSEITGKTYRLPSEAERHAESRERRAQFVRDIAQQLPLLSKKITEATGHVVEILTEVRQFVFA